MHWFWLTPTPQVPLCIVSWGWGPCDTVLGVSCAMWAMLPHLTLLPLFLPILDLIPNLHRTAARGRKATCRGTRGHFYTAAAVNHCRASHPPPTPACNSFAQGQGRFWWATSGAHSHMDQKHQCSCMVCTCTLINIILFSFYVVVSVEWKLEAWDNCKLTYIA